MTTKTSKTDAELTWVSVQEYQRHIGLTRSDVMKMIYAGTLPAVKIGTRYKINIHRADTELENLMHTPKDRPPQKVYDEIGKQANAQVEAAGGFLEALRQLKTTPRKMSG